jgi:spore germination protein YaaH
LNAGDADLVYQLEANNYHWLAPTDGATLGVYASLEPNLADCQSASMSSAPIAVESLSVGTYFCYTSNEGRIGRALLEAVNPDDFTLTLSMLTWALP